MTAEMVEIVPPIGDGCWWLVQCHTCREIVGRAVDTEYEAQRKQLAHLTDHADGTVAHPHHHLLTAIDADIEHERACQPVVTTHAIRGGREYDGGTNQNGSGW